MPKTILITGASRGIGLVTANLLAQHGYTVFGTSRNLRQSGEFEYLPLDVQDEASVKACVETVLNRTGRIDVLINNAGISLGGAVEEASPADMRQLFETNFFGVVRLTNAVLPHMRRVRSGLIINMSSLAGLVGVPYLGFYAASKHALVGYTTSLRYEVKPFGVHVTLVEPGDARTTIANVPPSNLIPDYNGVRERASAIHEANVRNGVPVARVAETILRITQSHHPSLRYSVTAGEQFWVPWMKRLLPEWLIERIIRNAYKLDG